MEQQPHEQEPQLSVAERIVRAAAELEARDGSLYHRASLSQDPEKRDALLLSRSGMAGLAVNWFESIVHLYQHNDEQGFVAVSDESDPQATLAKIADKIDQASAQGLWRLVKSEQ